MESAAGNSSLPRGGASSPLDLPRVEVKVVLRSRAGENESVWCTVVDPAKNLYRIDNIPFLRERPTLGDVIVATPGRDGLLGFRRTHAGGGFRWGALEYAEGIRFAPLVDWLEHSGVKAEGLFAAEGKAYLDLCGSRRPARGREDELRQLLPEPGDGARGAVLHVHPVWSADVRVHDVRQDREGAGPPRRPHVRDVQPAGGGASGCVVSPPRRRRRAKTFGFRLPCSSPDLLESVAD